MKKLLKLIAITAMAIGLIGTSFTSCSNLVDDATISGGTVAGAKTVTLTATSENDIVTFGNGFGRMIMPGQLNAVSGYNFWLFGKNITTGESLKETGIKIDFEPTSGDVTKGTVKLDLDIAQYELALYVISTGTTSLADETFAKSKAVLAATAKVDFTHSDTVNFYLSPYSLSANGGFDLELYLDGWTLASNYTSVVGIYKLTSMDVVKTKEETPSDLKKDFAPTDWPSTAASTPSYNFTSNETITSYTVEPGTYNFIVTFTNTTNGKQYCYNDKIVILSNRRTKKSIAIPNVIEELPKAPSAFGVSYLKPLSVNDDYYEVQFEWMDNAYNETNYKIELVDFTNVAFNADFEALVKTLAGATGEKDTDKDSKWASFTTGEESYKDNEIQYNFAKKITKQTPGADSSDTIADSFINAPEWWVDGSCFINSKTATIRLPLEHRFLARICAQNDAGDSEYAYVDLSGTTVTTSTGYKRYGTTEVAGTALSKFKADASSINLFRIRYFLDGGKFFATTAPTTKKIPTPTGATASVWVNMTAKIPGISPNQDAVVVYGTQRNVETSSNITNIFNPLLASTTDTTNTLAVLYQDTNRWTGWLVGSTGGETYTYKKDDKDVTYNKEATATYSAADPAPIVYKDWDAASNKIYTRSPNIGYTNIDLYATYRITGGNWYTDESAEYDIQDSWVQLYGSPTALNKNGIAAATAATAANHMYTFNKSNQSGTGNAYYLYPCLLNDANNNQTKAGNGITFTKVAYDVVYKGTTSKASYVSGATATVSYDISGGSSATDNTMSYAEIPLQKLPVGKYQIMIYAYADTQQGLYTYPIWVDIRDGNVVAPTALVTKTFATADISWDTAADPVFGAITAATSANSAVLSASVSSNTVTLKSYTVASDTDVVVTISDGTESVAVTFTVASADGAITVKTGTYSTTGAATSQGTLSGITLH